MTDLAPETLQEDAFHVQPEAYGQNYSEFHYKPDQNHQNHQNQDQNQNHQHQNLHNQNQNHPNRNQTQSPQSYHNQNQPQNQNQNQSQNSQNSSQNSHSRHHESPDFNPASATAGGREISKNVLYVGGMDKSISEEMLKGVLGSTGAVTSIKMLNDKNRPGYNYAFVEFSSDADASAALQAHNGARLSESELKINFAFQSSTFSTSQTPDEQLYNIFVGDLSPEADDEALYKFFAHFPSLKQAHVMWDMQTSRSRGYGFATFRDPQDAELALQTMGGKQLLGRAIRCNWASHKQQGSKRNTNQNHSNYNQNHSNYNQNHANYSGQNHSNYNNHSQNHLSGHGQNGHGQNNHNGRFRSQRFSPLLRNEFEPQFQMQQQFQMPQDQMGQPMMAQMAPPAAMGPSMTPQSYDVVLRQSPTWQTTVYLGNIAHFTEQNDLLPLLQNFGYIVDFKLHPDKGCAFVKFDSHERAALAIVQLAGFAVNGRPLRCGWGKSRPPNNQYGGYVNGMFASR